MNIRKTFTVASIALGIALIPAVAHADADPFTITDEGVQLTSGTFSDHDHVNIRTTTGQTYNAHFEGKCINRTDAECAGQRHLVAQSIGTSLLPWEALGIPEGTRCVLWGQWSGTNWHLGEPTQVVVGPDCAGPSDPEDPKTTPTDPPVTPEPTEEPTPEPTEEPEPTETPVVTPEPTETPGGPLEPAGSDMKPLLAGGAGLLVALGGALLIGTRARKGRTND